MNKILGILAGLVLLGSSVSTGTSAPTVVLPSCLQDQFGNQYQQLVQDSVHNIVTGVVNQVQSGCSGNPLTMVGSWTISHSGQTILELTIANNGNTSSCVPVYKLKGAYPTADWYYDNGYTHNQQFKYAACSASSPVVPDTGVGGTYGVK